VHSPTLPFSDSGIILILFVADYHYKTCHCCRGDDGSSHKTYDCPVCSVYKSYFHKHCALHCRAVSSCSACVQMKVN